MRNAQAQKIVNITPPGAIVDNTAFTTAVVDTKGYHFVTIVVLFGAMDIAMAALKLQESDASGSGFADVAGGDFATSPATLPSATSDNTMFAWQVDCRGARKRYLDVVATGGDGAAGTYMTAFAILSEAEIGPSDAAGRGFAQELFV